MSDDDARAVESLVAVTKALAVATKAVLAEHLHTPTRESPPHPQWGWPRRFYVRHGPPPGSLPDSAHIQDCACGARRWVARCHCGWHDEEPWRPLQPWRPPAATPPPAADAEPDTVWLR